MLRGLSQYRVLRDLARGGQGEVLLAFDMRLQRRVCIKLYHYEGGLRERRRLQREARRLAAVRSEHLVDVLDLVAHAGRVALVTRFVPGCTLADLVTAHGHLAAGAALAILSDLAAALVDLRRAGLVHGDLSPANVLIDEQGRAVLVDLGVAVLPGGRASRVSDLACTPEHGREGSVDLRSDFFALGLLLHLMLTGSHPFRRKAGIDRGALRRGLVRAPELSGLPDAARAGLRRLLLDLLAASPDDRPSDTVDVRERLRGLRSAVAPCYRLGSLALEAAGGGMAPARPRKLPGVLVRLPWYRRAVAALQAYWMRGSGGARFLLLVVALALPGLLALPVLREGPCVTVAPVAWGVGAAQLLAAPDRDALRDRLTALVKNHAGRAVVLGRGVASDSRPRLSARGLRDICVAQRSIGLSVSCEAGLCQLELQGTHGLDRYRTRRVLSPLLPQRDFRNTLDAMVREQLALLMP